MSKLGPDAQTKWELMIISKIIKVHLERHNGVQFQILHRGSVKSFTITKNNENIKSLLAIFLQLILFRIISDWYPYKIIKDIFLISEVSFPDL